MRSNWCHRRGRGCIQVTLDHNEPSKKLVATERLNNEHTSSSRSPFSLILSTPKRRPTTEVHESASAPIRRSLPIERYRGRRECLKVDHWVADRTRPYLRQTPATLEHMQKYRIYKRIVLYANKWNVHRFWNCWTYTVFETVAAASLLIASRGGASPQKFEKRALTIFRLEPDPYESAHQLDCSFLLPTATAYGTGR